MIRIFTTLLLLAGLSAPASHGGTATQPAPQFNSPDPYFVAPQGRSYLGVDIRDITSDRVAALKLKEERGVEVTMVDQDAPAGKAGIKEHDVILDFNGTAVESEEQLRRMIRETPPGRTVSLGISRDGSPVKINVQLADHSKVVKALRVPSVPPMPPMPELGDLRNQMGVDRNVFVIRDYRSFMGIQTENLNQQLGDFFGVKNGEGVLVRSVEKGGPAEKAGLKAGDVIVRIGDEKLSDRSDLARVIRSHRRGGKVTLGIVRDKREQTVTVELPARRTKDSSEMFVESPEMEALLDRVHDAESEVDSANELFDQAREMAELNLYLDKSAMEKAARENLKSMEDWKKSMPDYSKGMEDWKKSLQEYRMNFDRLREELKELQLTQDHML